MKGFHGNGPGMCTLEHRLLFTKSNSSFVALFSSSSMTSIELANPVDSQFSHLQNKRLQYL